MAQHTFAFQEDEFPAHPDAEKICDDINEKLEEWIDSLDDGVALSEAQFTEALGEFDKALVIDKTCLDAYLGRAYVLGLKNDQEGAKLVLQQALELHPTSDAAKEMLRAIENADEMGDDGDDADDSLDDGELLQKYGLDMDDMDDDDIQEVDPGVDISKLITVKGKLTKRFAQVLSEIYDRFNADHGQHGVWTDAALNEFHKVTNGTPIAKDSLEFLKSNFEVSPTGLLTQSGFEAFYLYQSATDGEETFKDLKALGYDDSLAKFAK